MSSAGNGTRRADSAADVPLWYDPPPLTEVSGSSFAAVALASRPEAITPFSVTAPGALTSGSTSRPGGATITGGSGDRPASSTPSSSLPTGSPSYLQQRLSDNERLAGLVKPLERDPEESLRAILVGLPIFRRRRPPDRCPHPRFRYPCSPLSQRPPRHRLPQIPRCAPVRQHCLRTPGSSAGRPSSPGRTAGLR